MKHRILKFLIVLFVTLGVIIYGALGCRIVKRHIEPAARTLVKTDEMEQKATKFHQHKQMEQMSHELPRRTYIPEPHNDAAVQATQTTSADSQTDSQIVQAESLVELMWFGWTMHESHDNFAQAGGDGGHAYGRYQFDDRHCLAGFMAFCLERDEVTFACFTRYLRYDSAGKPYLVDLETLPLDWKQLHYQSAAEFEALQTEYAVKAYYQPVCQELLAKGIDPEDYSPVLRGTVMSLAIRNGAYLSSIPALTETYDAGILEDEWLTQIYDAQAIDYPEQVERWGKNQKADALAALAAYESGSTLPEQAFEKVVIQ